MNIHHKWIPAALLLVLLPLLSCKIIGVDDDTTMVITVAIEHTFRSISPGNDPHTRTFTPDEYWSDDFNDWDIESADLTDISVTVWDVQSAERTVSAKFTLSLIDPKTPVNPLIANTEILTLGECVDNVMNVWNNKVTISSAGKARLLNALQNKRTITLSAPVQNLSGTCDFWTKAVVKFQVNVKKN